MMCWCGEVTLHSADEGDIVEHSSDDVITVRLEDTTRKHLGLKPGRGDLDLPEERELTPPDSNPDESQAALSELTRVATELGAQTDTTVDSDRNDSTSGRLRGRPTHYDHGIDITTIQNVLTTFAGGGGVAAGLLFLRQCRSLLTQWLENKASRNITVEHTTPDNRTWKINISGRNDLDEVLETLQEYEREEQEKRNTET
jgi:hypothetical protein